MHPAPAAIVLLPHALPWRRPSPEAVWRKPWADLCHLVHGLRMVKASLQPLPGSPFPTLALLLTLLCGSVFCMHRSPEGLVELVKGVGKIQGSKIHEVSPPSTLQRSALCQHACSCLHLLRSLMLACRGIGSGTEGGLASTSHHWRLPVEESTGEDDQDAVGHLTDCVTCRMCPWRAKMWSSTQMLWWSALAREAASQQRCLRKPGRRYAALGHPHLNRFWGYGV